MNLLTRRQMLQATGLGLGYVAFAGLAAVQANYDNPLAAKTPHLTPRAKRMIVLSMRGGPSHVDTFDYKPKLTADDGKTVTGPQNEYRADRKLMGSPFRFQQHGKSGLWISELFPYVARHADDLCMIHSMQTPIPNHPQAFLMMHTGEFRLTRPSMGSWLLYGLGTENQNLPGFVSINPPADLGGPQNYGSAFLPAIYQGTRLAGGRGPAIENISGHLPPDLQRRLVDEVQLMNQDLLRRQQVNLELEGVIESMELSFRMQGAVPEVMDLSQESRQTIAMYGSSAFGRQCLMARRLVEAGVRVVEIAHANWDQHTGLKANLTRNCNDVDQPIAALLTDLKRRGLLNETLVVWGGEFGRTPYAERADGRDHNGTGFTLWLAGGGVKGGFRYGATDEHGIDAVERQVHVHDLHATLLHLMGLDHTRLTYRYGGRDFRLTDVHGNVVNDIMT
jgi:hypothetical protein